VAGTGRWTASRRAQRGGTESAAHASFAVSKKPLRQEQRRSSAVMWQMRCAAWENETCCVDLPLDVLPNDKSTHTKYAKRVVRRERKGEGTRDYVVKLCFHIARVHFTCLLRFARGCYQKKSSAAHYSISLRRIVAMSVGRPAA
jgi:hypothetical protein